MDQQSINLSDRERSRRKPEHPWSSWYKSPIWKSIKRHRLVEEPNCRKCASEGKTVPACLVVHIEHHQGDWVLFARYDNTQSLCQKHLVQHKHLRSARCWGSLAPGKTQDHARPQVFARVG